MIREIKKIFKLLGKPYMKILPGNIAFSFMLAIIPILSVVVFILNILNFSFPIISNKLSNFIPGPVIEIIITFLSGNSWNNTVFMIVGLISASSGMQALIIASNVIYKCDNKKYIEEKVKSLLLTFLIIFIIIVNLGILVFGDALLRFVISLFNLNINILTLFSLLKWPLSFIIIYFILKIIYTLAPDIKIKSDSTSKGAMVTTILWVFASAIYSAYVSHATIYVDFYGSLANIIILLVWLYIMSIILVLGTAINVNEYNKTIEEQ